MYIKKGIIYTSYVSDYCTARGLKARQRHGLLVEVGAQVVVVVAVAADEEVVEVVVVVVVESAVNGRLRCRR